MPGTNGHVPMARNSFQSPKRYAKQFFTCGAREAAIVDDISRHYNKEIKEIKYDDEEGFITALEDAGLA